MEIIYVLNIPPFEEDLDGITKIFYNLIKNISYKYPSSLLIVNINPKKLDKNYIFYRYWEIKLIDTGK